MRRSLLLALWLCVAAWAEPRVLFLGEQHTNPADHQAQLKALQGLQANGSVLILAEMFTERAQGELQTWNDGAGPAIFESELWEREWGHPQELYQPIWNWARDNGVDVLWLRPDPDYTKKVKERGPASAVERIGELLIGPASYREFMEQTAASHGDGSEVDQAMVDRFFLVQCFWDEFMAWRIAQLASENPDATLVVLVGDGHLREGEGIPWRLHRRAPELQLEVRRSSQ